MRCLSLLMIVGAFASTSRATTAPSTTTPAATTTDTTTTTSTEEVCAPNDPARLGNGFCDANPNFIYNTALCNWDGGDCCPGTCVSTEENECGTANNNTIGFEYCLDPTQCHGVDADLLGNGYCNIAGNGSIYNTARCGWDGGDCCATTCNSTANHTCGYNADSSIFIGYSYCENPEVCRVPDPNLLGNAICNAGNDSAYNTEVCGWDGGDCCISTCVDTVNRTCGVSSSGSPIGWTNCEDPNACRVGSGSIGDGFCDGGEHNTERCGWDGGDCCERSCVSTANNTCGTRTVNGTVQPIGYNQCEDPANKAPDGCNVPTAADLGNGNCDNENNTNYNTAACDWDFGDCCSTTCEDGEFTCGYRNGPNGTIVRIGFNFCEDPDACRAASPELLGDGYCDDLGAYNTERCNWDEGDCCADTCTDGMNYTCGYYQNQSTYRGYPYCENPDICSVPDPTLLGNGYCNDEGGYNTERCGYDMGDCCEVSCVSSDMYACGYNANQTQYVGFRNCRDSNVCEVAAIENLGDGRCDTDGGYNTALCGWDGGDCCITTCSDGNSTCGHRTTTTRNFNGTHNVTVSSLTWIGFENCEDPEADPEGTCLENPAFLGNGFCNTVNGTNYNTEACDWDGGDCCVTTCVDTATQICGRNADNTSNVGYTCRDPNVCTANPNELGDAFCDADDSHNNARCGWDGGDCCEPSCVSQGNRTCGFVGDNEIGFERCIDPDNIYDFARLENCTVSLNTWGNGYCDQREAGSTLNSYACNWDGGDCCAQTCTDGDIDCGDKSASDAWLCADPSVLGPLATMYPDCQAVDLQFLGDGYCDSTSDYHNTMTCGWDGGDCCGDTCTGNQAYRCGTEVAYSCKDPNSSQYLSCPEPDNDVRARVNNGFCDMSGDQAGYLLNTLACDWDGGDCCPSTCNSTQNDCPNFLYNCMDPDASDTAETSTCFANNPDIKSSYFGDGACDDAPYNTAACGWDGGDCCFSTCQTFAGQGSYECGARRFQCLDPEAFENLNLPNTSSCTYTPNSHIGDGYCDNSSNVESCQWDGGDCCEETCEDGRLFDCDADFEVTCLNPNIGATRAPEVVVTRDPNATRPPPEVNTPNPNATRPPVATPPAPNGTRAPVPTRPTTTTRVIGVTTTAAPNQGTTTGNVGGGATTAGVTTTVDAGTSGAAAQTVTVATLLAALVSALF